LCSEWHSPRGNKEANVIKVISELPKMQLVYIIPNKIILVLETVLTLLLLLIGISASNMFSYPLGK
jgi:hypothetical protein